MDVKDHVIEVAVILPKGLTITDVAHPPPVSYTHLTLPTKLEV